MKVLLTISICLNVIFFLTISNLAGKVSGLENKWEWLNQKITEAILQKGSNK